ncbi:MAG: hypothetical protein ABW352_25430 [Polyangiales bacterium]
MGKSLPLSALAIALPLVACAPVTTSVVEVETRDARIVSDAQVTRDAGVQQPADKDSTALDPEEDDPEGCLNLRDQTFAVSDPSPAELARWLVSSRNSKFEGCTEGDAGAPLESATVCSRRDGLPILEKGQRYSYRWPPLWTALGRVHIVGGDEFCAVEKVVDVAHGYAFVAGTINPATCYEFTSPIEAQYLRIDSRDYPSLQQINLGKPPLRLKLCPTPCPAGSAADLPTDAGTDAGQDAGAPLVIPGWP